ncbi:MAG: Mur ligase family protein [Acidobacteriota bacterium]|nr:Mur ligase family protein [Acidobacteriota bacterium]
MSPLPIFEQLLEWNSFSPGLTRVRRVLERLGNPFKNFPHILVGGTNGKGTVATTVAGALPGKVGLFLSPHLVDIRERITINGHWLPDKAWQAAYRRITSVTPIDDLSYFECLMVLAVDIFAKAEVDWAVFEVGLGGRTDAVNCLEPTVSVITNVSLDHQKWLGKERHSIALEKIEIARPGKPLVLPREVLELEGVAMRLEQIGCYPQPVSTQQCYEDNLTISNKLLDMLGFCQVVQSAPIIGRRQFLDIGFGVYLDGAHNEAAWRDLVCDISTRGQKVNILCSLSSDRDPFLFHEIMGPVTDRFFLWKAGFERELPESAWPSEIQLIETENLGALLEGPLLVCGSLYVVGAFIRWLEQNGINK